MVRLVPLLVHPASRSMQARKMAGRASPDMNRPSASGSRVGSEGNLQGDLPRITRERSLVADDPDSERIPARTACAAFSLLVLGLVRSTPGKPARRGCHLPAIVSCYWSCYWCHAWILCPCSPLCFRIFECKWCEEQSFSEHDQFVTSTQREKKPQDEGRCPKELLLR